MLILSKGHAYILLYVILSDLGYFHYSELNNYGKPNVFLQCHPNLNIPGVFFPSGSLGQGLSGSVGMALTNRKLNNDCKIYVVLIIDYNNFQLDGATDDIMHIPNLTNIFTNNGFYIEDINGHEYKEVDKAIIIDVKKTLAILCRTTKGKEISFMENNNEFHSSYLIDKDYNKAIAELEIR
ncbi:hypothetical protein ACJDT4_08955 [Clostridium neuense]|uniref:Transketolase N-terminal domain-containing protein n=1 Tax=Clostridium neuense TaxID=1728934 RepID=A0ABW8TEB3_9CLOT